ncbi:DUF7139 domain-containing protein [Halomarina oriensis]|uniref:Permease n=1 Tax=Halomarina oriensis TaxID=671145 RepID=A0A6B0GLE5_9EURY|nr:permease [Halomarina oriensis]MWG33603.1 permease [Halomarina oriensis]
MSDDGSIEATLVEWYRRFIGEPERQIDVYAGFALFFGGLALALVGLILFVLEQVAFGPGKTFWLREIAFAVGAAGLPTLFLGVTVLLPLDKRARIGALVGEGFSLAAIALFVWAHPWQWNVNSGVDYSVQGVGLYALGVVTVVAATFAALVSYHVERASPDKVVAEATEEDTGPEVTDEDVRRDIDEAMANTEMTWGGVPKDNTRRITVNDDSTGLDTSGFEGVEAKSHRSAGGSVDAAVAGLQGMRGGEPARETSRGSGTDDQAAALARLQEEQRKDAEREEKMADLNSGGIVGRLKSMLNLG